MLIILLYFLYFLVFWFGIKKELEIGLGVRFFYFLTTFLYFGLGPIIYFFDGNFELVENLSSAIEYSMVCQIIMVIFAYFVFPYLLGDVGVSKLQLQLYFTAKKDLLFFKLIGLSVLFWPVLRFASGIPSIAGIVGNLIEISTFAFIFLTFHYSKDNFNKNFYILILLFCIMSLLKAIIFGFLGGSMMSGLLLVCMFCFNSGFKVKLLIFPLLLGVIGYLPYQVWIKTRLELRTAIDNEKLLSVEETLNLFQDAAYDVLFEKNSQGSVSQGYSERGDFLSIMQAALIHTPEKQPFGYGESYADALIAWIPRAIWQGKTFSLGGSAFVSKYTGIYYDKSTSVGMNHLFEAYVNFGIPGCLLPLILLSFLFTYVDFCFKKYFGNELIMFFSVYLLISCTANVDTLASLVMNGVSAFVVSLILFLYFKFFN